MVKHIFSQLSIFPTRSFNKRGTDIDRVLPSFFYSFEKSPNLSFRDISEYMFETMVRTKLELAICSVPALSFQMPFLLFR